MKTTVDVNPMKLRFPGQPIQWHLPTTEYDRCPRCAGPLGLLTPEKRVCMSPTGPPWASERLMEKPDAYYAVHGTCPPGTVWMCLVSVAGFLREMETRGEEAVRLGRGPGRPRKVR